MPHAAPDAPPDAVTIARTIRPIRLEERGELDRVIVKNWGSPYVVSRESLHRVSELPCVPATDGNRGLGVAAYRLAAGACELVRLEAFERGHGTGTALPSTVVEIAMDQGRA